MQIPNKKVISISMDNVAQKKLARHQYNVSPNDGHQINENFKCYFSRVRLAFY